MNPLDELLYALLGLPLEWLGAMLFAKMVSDLPAGLFGLACLVALVRPLPLLRTRSRAVIGLALAIAWIGVWWWIPAAFSAAGEALRWHQAIFGIQPPAPPPPPPGPALPP